MSDRMDFIQSYCERLRVELKGCDPALIMDATNDAYEYLSNEIESIRSTAPQKSIEEAFEAAALKFGEPHEVARAFLEMEEQVKQALSFRSTSFRNRGWRRFWGIITDMRAYTSLLYMVLSIVTGIVGLIWVGYGLFISVISTIFIIGIPICILYFGSVRGLALIESRLIEILLGERMPRRPIFVKVEGNILTRFNATIRDPQNWKATIYLLLMCPIGLCYALIIAFILGTSIEFLIVPFIPHVTDVAAKSIELTTVKPSIWLFPLTTCISFFLLLIQLHLARYIGRFHARFAKFFLVERIVDEQNK